MNRHLFLHFANFPRWTKGHGVGTWDRCPGRVLSWLRVLSLPPSLWSLRCSGEHVHLRSSGAAVTRQVPVRGADRPTPCTNALSARGARTPGHWRHTGHRRQGPASLSFSAPCPSPPTPRLLSPWMPSGIRHRGTSLASKCRVAPYPPLEKRDAVALPSCHHENQW